MIFLLATFNNQAPLDYHYQVKEYIQLAGYWTIRLTDKITSVGTD